METNAPEVVAVAARRVGSGVDTLYLNVAYASLQDAQQKKPETLDSDLAYQLDDLKSLAKEQETEVPTPWYFHNVPLMLHPFGTGQGQWSWLLTHPHFNLTVAHGRLNGIIAQVRVSSSFLWSHEWCGSALAEIHDFLMVIFGERIYLQVSEVHLCTDVINWKPDADDWQRRFISRAVSDDIHLAPDTEDPDKAIRALRQWKDLSTLQFGRASGRLYVVIYNKSLEIEQKSKKVWMYDLWSKEKENDVPVWDGKSEVWRVEARFKRPFLHTSGIEGAYDFLNHVKDIWGYAVGHAYGGDDGMPDGWLRLAIPGTDTNRTRWEVDPAWKVVQGAFDEVEQHYLGELPFKVEKEQNIQRLVQQISGCVSSLAAQGADLYPILGANLFETMEWLTHAIEEHHRLKEVSFSAIVTEKRLKLASLGNG